MTNEKSAARRVARALILVSLISLATAVLAVASGPPRLPKSDLVRCEDIIRDMAAPNPIQRVLLQHIALPPERFATRLHYSRYRQPFPYFAKDGIGVRYATAAVELVVPAAWRQRFAIGWGSPARAASSVRIPPCTGIGYPSDGWRAYAGGYWVRKPACVPLIVRVGSETTSIRLGIGVTCPADPSE